jgi:hypothetical protein
MKRIIRFLKVAILSLFGASAILLIGGIHFSATGINQAADFLEPAYQGDEYFEEFNPKSDYFWPYDDILQERNAPEIIQL